MDKIITIDKLSHYNNNIQSIIDSKIQKLMTDLDSYAKITDIPSIKLNNSVITPISGVVDLGYINKELVTFTTSSISLLPNVYYRNTNTNLTTLTITLSSETNIGVLNEYLIEFTTSAGGTTISLPSSIKWVNGEKPTFDANSTYQISIVNNLGVCIKFA